ncbi:hypothetical protein D0T25_23885 [Duganella sp. BJB488]|uniref:hypothetical protein n=1 Tax=unclassified Duganella TaxID=2636909 RepID=UPI000E347D6D|nr:MULTISPECIES: hypothetical protein [unclassified Duganella]RFP09220.1 hypothetical protein D0T23_26250 [Duganella sp. BJB475]RFP13295.1 hypothetical protein D0T26_23735 [Duganella sp. BJB489]RFP17129.1 hypothetical protein D0T25_23885 [Duganella sp. BJB488]RFP25446.1 hypothetical protein D0T21_28335 [Duganella sp. BJB476]RFP31652.1 hypothetical protein D0T24_24830 [Duganella sp. BJB480]
MKFSQAELGLIAAAQRKTAGTIIKRWGILALMLIGLVFFLFGFIDSGTFVQTFVVAILLAVAVPEIGGGPKYHELVKLLEKARDEAQDVDVG